MAGRLRLRQRVAGVKSWRVEEFDIPVERDHAPGADWGYAIDPSVLVQCFIEGRNLYVPHEAYMIGCEITQLPDLFDRVPDSRKWFITVGQQPT